MAGAALLSLLAHLLLGPSNVTRWKQAVALLTCHTALPCIIVEASHSPKHGLVYKLFCKGSILICHPGNRDSSTPQLSYPFRLSENLAMPEPQHIG